MTLVFRWFGLAAAILNVFAASAVILLMDSPYASAYHFAGSASVVCALALLYPFIIRTRAPHKGP